jgi:hypothetical protein
MRGGARVFRVEEQTAGCLVRRVPKPPGMDRTLCFFFLRRYAVFFQLPIHLIDNSEMCIASDIRIYVHKYGNLAWR